MNSPTPRFQAQLAREGARQQRQALGGHQLDLSRRLDPDNGSFLQSQPPGVGAPSPPPRATVMASAGPGTGSSTSSLWLATSSPLPTISLEDLQTDLDPNQILREMFGTPDSARSTLSTPD